MCQKQICFYYVLHFLQELIQTEEKKIITRNMNQQWMECDIEQNVASDLRWLELEVLVHMCNKIKTKSGQRGHRHLAKTLAVWDLSSWP